MTTAGAPVYAVQGGSPTDPNSCYSDCGDLVAPTQNCYCDAACESKGDCCVDKHEWCAPAAAKPVCSLVDDTKATSQICGTDLGVSFVHNNRIEILFGDTWHYANPNASGPNSCSDPGVGGLNDDAQARFVGGVNRPSWVPQTIAPFTPTGTCKSLANNTDVLDFDRTATAAPYTFVAQKLKGLDSQDIPLGLVNTPLAAFSDGVSAYSLFVAAPRSEDIGFGFGKCHSTADPAGLTLWTFCKHVYVARRKISAPLDRTQYEVIKDLGYMPGLVGSTTHFLNPTVARATSLSNFDTPTTVGGGELFVWGRPDFSAKETQAGEANNMYLMRLAIPAPTGLGTTWSPSYYAGLDGNGQPTWSPNETSALALLNTDFRQSRQIDIKWIKEIRKWVMLYGGDVADFFRCDLLCETAACRTACLQNLPGPDQPRHGALHMRTSDNPWGPWSRPTPLLWREAMGLYYQCDSFTSGTPLGCDRSPVYGTGDWEPFVTSFTQACQTSHPKPTQTPNAFNFLSLNECPLRSQRGDMYAPNILPTWTRHTPATLGNTASTTIYFNVSTFYPYDVVLAAADLETPKVTYPLQMQLRHALTSKMVGGTGLSTPTFTRTAGGTNGGNVAFQIDKLINCPASCTVVPATPGEQMKTGDRIVLRHVNDSNRLLARTGATGVTYIAAAATPPASAQWIVRGPPTGYVVAPGTTMVALEVPGSSPITYLKTTADLNNLQPTIGSGDLLGQWLFTYHCQTTDPDGPGSPAALPDICTR